MSDPGKPVLFLDIDGVLNGVAKQKPLKAWPERDWHKAIYTEGSNRYPLMWSTPVVDWITGLHASGRVEIRWHTSWQQAAHEFARIVGLPAFAVQDCPEFEQFMANGSRLAAQLIAESMPGWWKYPAVHRFLAEGRPVIWIDDEIIDEVPRRLRHLLTSQHKLCLVIPTPGSGIARKQMVEVEAFLNGLEDPRGAVSGS